MNPSLTAAFVTRTLKLPDSSSKPTFGFVTSDSRQVAPGCLFVALKGEKFDGEDFIADAVAKGATGILCQIDRPNALDAQAGNSAVFFRVKDTLTAYRALGAAWRREFQIPVLVVAGSNGKTTTKELLASALSGKFKNVLKTQGSENGFVGIPLTLLELRPSHDIAVIEVGIDEPGAMAQHISLVSPTGAVLTAIGPEHLEKLRDLKTVAHEECLSLSLTAENGGFIAINLNDSLIRPRVSKSTRKLSYALAGTPEAADADLIGEVSADAKSLRLMGHASGTLPLMLPGRHNALNTLSGAALALLAGLTPEEISHGLARFSGLSARSEVKFLAGDTPVLCDYYNAQPLSVAAGLDLLAELGRGRTQWACLADMLELGPDEERFHRELADRICAHRVAQVLLYGPRMRWLTDELTRRPSFSGKVRHYPTHAELASVLIAELKPGDAVMIKGSRGMKMEEIWKPLSQSSQWKTT